MRKPCFGSLPDEILSNIILQLPMVDILRCRMVSKTLNRLVKNSTPIQYAIELAANGLVSCCDSTLSAAASIRILREQQDAWRRCEWKEEKMIQLRTGCRSYEFRNGVWAFGYRHDGAPVLPPQVARDSSTTLACFNLISSKDNVLNQSQWSLDDLGIAVRDFTMDPLIDLLAFVEETTDSTSETIPFRVHLRTLSNGQPHQMAQKHVLDMVMSSSNPAMCAFGVQLQGSYFGILVQQDSTSGDYDNIMVWNWCTGDLRFKMDATQCSFDDFAFIDTCTIVLAVIGDPVMLQVWRFDSPRVFYVGSFGLPLTAPGNAYLQMHFDGGPSASIAGARTLDGTPFALSPVPQLMSITLQVIEPDPDMQEAEVTTFTMIMRLSLMFEALAQLHDPPKDVSRDISGGELLPDECISSRTLAWKEWGPKSTRWLREEPDHRKWEPCLVGGRFATVTDNDPDPGDIMYMFLPLPQVIRVYDFRPYIVSRYMQSYPEDVCTTTSVILKSTLFQEDIHSMLPYHMATSKELPMTMSGVMIDEGRLVCTKADPDNEWRKIFVYSF